MKKRKSTIWGMVMIAILLGTVFLTGCFDDGGNSKEQDEADYYLSVTVIVTNRLRIDAKVTEITMGLRSGGDTIRSIGTGNEVLRPGDTERFSGWFIPSKESGWLWANVHYDVEGDEDWKEYINDGEAHFTAISGKDVDVVIEVDLDYA